MSFAGEAAGGDLSSMFWNPAAMTQFAGVNSNSSVSWIIPYSAHSPAPASTFFPFGGTSNTGDQALVPASYFSYQVTPNLWVGMSVNAPFGLSVTFPNLWAGTPYAEGNSFLHTYNFTPSVAYRINDWISIGAGVQIQYAKASLTHGAPLLLPSANLSGDGWGYGFTAGITLTPTPTTTIGIGYRSFIDQKLSGNLALAPVGTFGASTTINLPDMVSLGVRQRVDPQLTLLGTVEWTNWSRIGTSVISTAAPVPAAALNLPFNYQDGWLFALGAEYQATDRLTVRGGVGYEISPITDDVRMPLLPDNDRFWLSAGLTWQIWRGFSADLAYSHIFVRDTHIDISAASGNPWFFTSGVTYIGDVDSHVDILSIAIKYRWDEPKVVKTGLITK
jgi:long-chain fatty acid transport protein